MRLAPTRLVPFSYFWICWKVRPSASPSFSWLMPSIMRRMRTRLPTYLSTGLGAFDISVTPCGRHKAKMKRASRRYAVKLCTQRDTVKLNDLTAYRGGISECELYRRSVNRCVLACHRYFREKKKNLERGTGNLRRSRCALRKAPHENYRQT